MMKVDKKIFQSILQLFFCPGTEFFQILQKKFDYIHFASVFLIVSRFVDSIIKKLTALCTDTRKNLNLYTAGIKGSHHRSTHVC